LEREGWNCGWRKQGRFIVGGFEVRIFRLALVLFGILDVTLLASALSVLTNLLCFLGLVLLLEKGVEKVVAAFTGWLVLRVVDSKMGSGDGGGGVLAFESRPLYLRTRKATY
jgi:hypothetical protein